MTSEAKTLPRELAIAVSFHFREERLQFLSQVASHFSELAEKVRVWVVTNRSDADALRLIRDAVSHESLEIVTPTFIGHPYLLTWSHREIFRTVLENRGEVSHFLYLEDDLAFTAANMSYWMQAEQQLTPLGLIPGFVRFEYTSTGGTVASDIYRQHNLWDMSRVVGEHYSYINFRYPYQGMYLMNRAMAQEFFSGPTSSPDFGTWNIREKATQGLIYSNVPSGCFSRSFVGYVHGKGVDSGALVHHIPNNYADGGSKYGSIPIDQLVSERRIRLSPHVQEWSKFITLRKPKRRTPRLFSSAP